jgi:hypothetical protein
VRVSEEIDALDAEVVFPTSVDVSLADVLASECEFFEVSDARVVPLE